MAHKPNQSVTFTIPRPRLLAVVIPVVIVVIVAVVAALFLLRTPSTPETVTVLGAGGTISERANVVPEVAPSVPPVPTEAPTPASAEATPATTKSTDGLFSAVSINGDYFTQDLMNLVGSANIPVTGITDQTATCAEVGCVEAFGSDQITIRQFASVEAARPYTISYNEASATEQSSYQIGSIVMTFGDGVDERMRGWYRSTLEKIVSGQEIIRHP